MAVCNVKWDVLVLIRDLQPMKVKDGLACSLRKKEVCVFLWRLED